MIDFTSYVDYGMSSLQPKTILRCVLRLDKITVLHALLCESIIIDGNLYEVPERQLVEILQNESFGFNTIDFTQKL